jgi:hypothetical protein
LRKNFNDDQDGKDLIYGIRPIKLTPGKNYETRGINGKRRLRVTRPCLIGYIYWKRIMPSRVSILPQKANSMKIGFKGFAA